MPNDNANELLKKLQQQQQGEEGSHDAGKLLDEAASDAAKREQLLMQMLASMSGGGIMSNLIGAIKHPWYQGLTPGSPNSLTQPTLASQRPGLPIGGGGGTGTSDSVTPQGGYGGGGGTRGGGGDFGGGGASGDIPPSPISRARTPFHDTRTWAGLGSGGRGKTPWHSSHPGISSGHYPGTSDGVTPQGGYGGESYGSLKDQRESFRKELQANPALRQKMMTIAANENNDPRAQQSIMESMMNRAAMRGKSLASEVTWVTEKGYYDDRKGRHRGISAYNNPQTRSGLNSRLEAALGGSNVSNWGTGNASGDFVEGRIQQGRYSRTAKFGGESFVTEGPGYQKWRQSVGRDKPTSSSGGESFGPSGGKGGGFGRGGQGQNQGGGGGSYPGGGGVIEAQGREAATRKGALNPTLRGQLEYAAQRTGLTFHATSGGQRMEGAPGATGSHRHDHGNAADGYLTDKNGRKLSMSNPEDRKHMGEFIKHSVAAGATGVGGAEGYMGEHNLHIGGGTPGTWGAGGSGKNTPGWVREAHQAGQSASARQEYQNRGQNRPQAAPQVQESVKPPSTTPKGDRLDRAPAENQKQEQLREALGDKYKSVKPYLTPENMKKYDKLLNPETLKQYKDYITPDTLRSYLGEPGSIQKEKLTKKPSDTKPPLQSASYTTQDVQKDLKKQDETIQKGLEKRIEQQKKEEPAKPKAEKRHAHRSQHTGVSHHHETPHRRPGGGHLGSGIRHERRHHEEQVASGDGGTLVFLHGIHDRYAGSDGERNKKKDEIEKSVRAYATAHGYRDVKFVSGKLSQEQQQNELSNMIKSDKSINGVFGFSRGGYSAHKALNSLPEEQRNRIKQAIILGAPGTGNIHGVPTTNRGHMSGVGHMDMVQNWTSNQGTESGKSKPGGSGPEAFSGVGRERIRTSAGKTVISTPADHFLASRITGVGPTAFEGARKEGYSRSSSDLTMNYAIRGMSPETRFALSRAIEGYEKETGHKFHFTSAYRSPKGKGSSMASGRGSYHGGHGKGPGFGEAVDVGGAGKVSKDAQGFLQYLKRHPEMGLAPKGLHFRDTGHTEFAGSRGGKWGGWSPEQKDKFHKDFNEWMGKKSGDTPQPSEHPVTGEKKDQSRPPEPTKHSFSDYQKRNRQIQDSAARHGTLHQPPPPPADTANKNPTVRNISHTPQQSHERKNTTITADWSHSHRHPSTAASSRVENAFVKPKTGRDSSFSEAGHSNA